MRHEKVEGTTHIYLDEGETEQQVLRAIVKASFELARPAGLGWMHFNDSQQMADEIADQLITLEGETAFKQFTKDGLVPVPESGRTSTVVAMDYVQGRQCKTYIRREGNGHFTLGNRAYECDRGTPEPMLDKAKEILAGKQSEGLASTAHMYKGESLNLRLQEYGFARKNGESDWDFRKRIFPDLFQKVPDGRALEFLFGSSAAEWNEMDKLLVLVLMEKGKPSYNELVKFAKGFGWDPSETRGQATQ